MCDSALTPIGNCPRKFTGKLVVACALAALLTLSGCGGDDDEPATTPAEAETTPTATVETPTETEPPEPEPEPEPETSEETGPAESPEDDEGGAGDEEPARTLALFTARGGRITPRVVRVPAFISIQVELRSADGREYELDFGDITLVAGGELMSVSATFDGLRPGEAITGRPRGAGNRVRVEATAEPGP